jgi:hypothetical protein
VEQVAGNVEDLELGEAAATSAGWSARPAQRRSVASR